MHSELPLFKRCCFCMPLRYGLIAWGYIKLACAGLLIVAFSSMIRASLGGYQMHPNNERIYTYRITVPSILLSIMILDFVLSAIFIVGGHLKKLRLMTVYYYYSFVLFILFVLLSMFLMSSYINSLIYRMASFYEWTMTILEFSGYFVSLVSQGYFLLLLRSEILKLSNNCEFRFVNNAAQSECKMDCSKEIPDETKTTEKDECCKVTNDV